MTGVTPWPCRGALPAQVLRPGADAVRMSVLTPLSRALRAGDDALADQRDRIVLIMSALSAVLLLPFTFNHFVAGRVLLGTLILAAQAMMAVNAWSLRAGRAPVVPFWVMVLGFMVAVCESIHRLGLAGTYWAFPTVLVSHFMLSRRLALLLSMVMLLGSTALVWQGLGLPVAVRFGATLALTLIMVNVVLNVLGDLQRALVQQTLTDPLTGAYNRRHLAQQLALLARPDAAALGMNALLAIDIDHFKSINDRHGHAAGDAALVAMVAALSARKRQSDMLFRTGGEEFVLLLPRTSTSDARQVAEALRQRIADSVLLPGHPITVSIGVGVQQAHHSADDWLDAADRALYQAKHNGRNRVEVST
jgi:diguanylate cyclase (GGDEF)-like protein